jgi:Lrp/AsnC family transcriptional regulator for asnA, asnC and gidA
MGRRKSGMLMDSTDARIIALVQRDGRLANTAIARAVGLSEAAVRKRLDRLVRDGVIHFRAHADPLKVGFQIWAIIEVQTVPRLTTRVAEQIAELPGVIVVGLVTGNFDVYAVGLFRSTEDFNTFIIDRLRKIRGVTHTTTSYITKAIKRDFAFGVPILDNAIALQTQLSKVKPQRRRRKMSRNQSLPT